MDDASGSETRTSGSFPRYLSSLLEVGTTSGLSDGQLLDLFLTRRDASAEVAFAAILERHGGMVRRVCREVLEDSHDADDAFQATFLILARSAGGIRIRGSLGPWLHGVALRVSRRSRSDAARRRRHERRHVEMAQSSVTPEGSGPVDPEVGRALHEEIGRLGEKFRSPVVLCYLEGLTHEMAAEQIGCPVGTIRSRLASARDRLKGRLMRRGFAPSLLPSGLAKLGDVAITSAPSVPISSSLAETTLRAALRIGAGNPSLGGLVSASVAALVEEGLRAMFWTKVKLLAVTIVSVGAIASGAGVAGYSYRPVDQGEQAAAQASPAPIPKKADPGPAVSKGEERPRTRLAQLGYSPQAEARINRESQERVRELIREYRTKSEEWSRAGLKIQDYSSDEGKALLKGRPDEAMYAGALLSIADRAPGTPAAEEALIWIVNKHPFGSIPERARTVLARDFAGSGKLAGLFDLGLTRMTTVSWGSPANEALLRAIADGNADPANRGRACYFLARLLMIQSDRISLDRLSGDDPPGRIRTPVLYVEGWGRDFRERLDRKAPDALAREAEALLERVIATPEFATIPADPADRALYERPATLGEAAAAYLDELRRLSVGKPAPEIVGVDLDGRPMKLSDHRGQVVALHFCSFDQVGDAQKPAPVTAMVRDAAEKYREEGFVALGVPVPRRRHASQPDDPSHKDWPPAFLGFEAPDHDTFKKVVEAARLPFRFWWDQGPKDQPGPIARDWHASSLMTVIIDHRGIIRARGGPIEEAVKPLLQERKKDLSR